MNIAWLNNGVFFGGLYVKGYNVILIYERGGMTFITEWFDPDWKEGEKWMEMEVSEYINITLWYLYR